MTGTGTAFVATLRCSRLLADADFARAVRLLDPTESAADAAPALVSGGLLTGRPPAGDAPSAPRPGRSPDDTSPWYGIESEATVENLPTPVTDAAVASPPRRRFVALALGCGVGTLLALATLVALAR